MRSKLLLGVLMLVGCTLGIAPGCGGGDDGGGSAGSGGGGAGGSDAGTGGAGADASTGPLDMWTAWEQLRTALRQSPDHYQARAEALVQAKDPAKLFELVRDQIVTYPPDTSSFYGAVGATRWGVKATLRGGAGTPREKAELLVDLYHQAGLEAEVVSGQADPAKLDGKAVLLRTYDRKYTPAITPTQASDWATALGHTTLKQIDVVDADGSKAKALAASLQAKLPSGLASNFDFTLDTIPLVRVKVNGAWTYANPLAASATFGDSLTTGTPTPVSGADPSQHVRIKLEAARADDPYTRFTLVQGDYDVADLVGRRVQIAFPPPVDQKTLVGMRPSDVEMVVPVLAVTGSDMTQADRDKLSFAGNLFSLGGDEYAEASGGGLTVNGESLAPSTTDPAAIAKVVSVKANANGSAFPRIRVDVSALDSGGKNVPKLGASAFDVREDGQPVSFALSRNEAPPPRVVLLYDTSTSIPPAFLGSGAVDLGNQIVQPLYAKYPNAQVRVAGMSFGADWASGTWATTLTEAQAQVSQLASMPGQSSIWEALADAEKQNPTVILMVTDGDASDAKTPEAAAAVAAGVPVLSIGVGTVVQTTLDDISTLSGGKSTSASQLSDATNAALAEIDARAVEDYRISYQAPKGTASTRNVTVTINAKPGAGSYTVPSQPVVPKALSGLYLTIELPNRSHTSTVAGFGLGYSTAFPTITQAMLDDVHSLLLGGITLKVEGASPSPSEVLDDLISEKLTLRPYIEALETQDEAKIFSALEPGLALTPAKLALAQPGFRDAQSAEALTFETGPRVAAFIQKASPGGKLTQELDLFPLSQWATAATDGAKAWQKTLEATASLAIMEAEMFNGPSTYEALQGQTVNALAPGDLDTQAGLTDQEKLAWAGLGGEFGSDYTLIAPLKPGPFWAVDTKTGTVIGVLPSGTGGGAEDVCNDYNYQNSVAQIMSLLGSFFGVSVGPWVALGQWEVKYVTMATLVIGYGAAAGDLSNPLVSMGCGAASDWLTNAENTGALGAAAGLYDTIAGTYNTVNPTGAQMPTMCGGADSYNPCQ
jgi:hypothetical protein